MRRFLLLLMSVFLVAGTVSAQRFEYGLTGGVANYLGDLSPEVVLAESNPMFGFQFKKNLSSFAAWRFGINYGKISGHDSNFAHLAVRNLQFNSGILEFNTIWEFNFLPFTIGLRPQRFTPYLFFGVAGFHFNPKSSASLADTVNIRLQPLGTEGQHLRGNNDNDYKLWQVSIPFGGGFKYTLSKDFNLALEAGYRRTFTDYLDDVSGNYVNPDVLLEAGGSAAAAYADPSEQGIAIEGRQRGSNDWNDWYIFTGLTLTYRIKNPDCFSF